MGPKTLDPSLNPFNTPSPRYNIPRRKPQGSMLGHSLNTSSPTRHSLNPFPCPVIPRQAPPLGNDLYSLYLVPTGLANPEWAGCASPTNSKCPSGVGCTLRY